MDKIEVWNRMAPIGDIGVRWSRQERLKQDGKDWRDWNRMEQIREAGIGWIRQI